MHWRQEIAYLLDADGGSTMFVKLVLRQRDVLKLAFWHATILVHRPFLLKTFTAFSGYEGGANEEQQVSSSSRTEELRRNIHTCVDAAVQITEYIDRISATGELYSTLFVSRAPF